MLHHRSPGQRTSNGQAPGSPLIDVRQVVKTYSSASGPFTALKGVSPQRVSLLKGQKGSSS
jgi:hypothetical protein